MKNSWIHIIALLVLLIVYVLFYEDVLSAWGLVSIFCRSRDNTFYICQRMEQTMLWTFKLPTGWLVNTTYTVQCPTCVWTQLTLTGNHRSLLTVL